MLISPKFPKGGFVLLEVDDRESQGFSIGGPSKPKGAALDYSDKFVRSALQRYSFKPISCRKENSLVIRGPGGVVRQKIAHAKCRSSVGCYHPQRLLWFL